jgi:hypothetical protein
MRTKTRRRVVVVGEISEESRQEGSRVEGKQGGNAICCSTSIGGGKGECYQGRMSRKKHQEKRRKSSKN